MNQQNIKLVLSYCKISSKFFQVSRVFESIYFEIVYESDDGKVKIFIESYEQNHEFMAMIKSKDIKCEVYDYWFNRSTFDINMFMWSFFNHFLLLLVRFVPDEDKLSWSYKQYNIKVVEHDTVTFNDNKLKNYMSIISKSENLEIVCNGISYKSKNAYSFKIWKSDLQRIMQMVYMAYFWIV